MLYVSSSPGQPLPSETLNELLSIVERDSDPAVWQQALSAIRQDARESAFHLAAQIDVLEVKKSYGRLEDIFLKITQKEGVS